MVDTSYTDLATCPYCGHVERDSWEIGDGGECDTEHTCGQCDKEYEVSRYLRIFYTTRGKLPVTDDDLF